MSDNMDAATYERAILERYSTPGLRRSELSREAKKDALDAAKVSRVERDEILDRLYGVKL